MLTIEVIVKNSPFHRHFLFLTMTNIMRLLFLYLNCCMFAINKNKKEELWPLIANAFRMV